MEKSQVVVITGATAGLGRAIARKFAKEGACIGLIARGDEGLEATKKEIEDMGVKAIIAKADVSNYEEIENAAEIIEKELGPIDVWVNNAMTSVFASFLEISPEEFKRVTEVNYLGYVYATRVALKRMKPRDKGAIVQIGSALAYRSIPLQSAYCGSKHAINGFTDSIRSELIHDKSNIHITAVHMPALNTTQFESVLSRLPNKSQPVPPIYQPEVGADAVYWAANNKRREVWVGSPTWKAIVGNKFIPGLLDWFLSFKGYSGQQTNEPDNDRSPGNLWVSKAQNKDIGSHGKFDRKAKDYSTSLWLETKGIIPTLFLVGATGLLTAYKIGTSKQKV